MRNAEPIGEGYHRVMHAVELTALRNHLDMSARRRPGASDPHRAYCRLRDEALMMKRSASTAMFSETLLRQRLAAPSPPAAPARAVRGASVASMWWALTK